MREENSIRWLLPLVKPSNPEDIVKRVSPGLALSYVGTLASELERSNLGLSIIGPIPEVFSVSMEPYENDNASEETFVSRVFYLIDFD
ncbi:hypothetical protein N7486_008766 [Penicillium sp. IBT 16267x]|nr:hypothetical protein N7486_008766 [Penicillium sp. IBT 16267x]